MDLSPFQALFDRFLTMLATVDGLHHEDTDFLLSDVRSKLLAALQSAEELAAHRKDEDRAVAARRLASAEHASKQRKARSVVSAKLSKTVDQLEGILAEKLFEHSSDPRSMFLHFDVDGEGTLSAAEFRRAVNEVGVLLSPEETKELVRRYDLDHSGVIDYVEFVRVMEARKWQSVSASSYSGLDRSHNPVDPSQLKVPTSEEHRLRLLRDAVLSKVRSHYGSARELYFAVKHSSREGGSVSLASLRSGLRRIGLSISLDDLVQMTADFTLEHPGLALSMSELQLFLDTAASATPTAAAGSGGAEASHNSTGAAVVKTPNPRHLQTSLPSSLMELLDYFHGHSDALELALSRYDMDSDGFLNADEFKRALAIKGYRVPKETCQEIIAAFHCRVPGKLPAADLILLLRDSDPTASYKEQTSSSRIMEAAAASAARRGSIGGAGGRRGSRSGSGSRPTTAPAVAAGRGPVPSPSHALVQRVADAIYSNSHSVHSLYKRMASTHAGMDATDLVHGLKRLGCVVTPTEALSLVREFDTNGDGHVSHSELVTMLSSA